MFDDTENAMRINWLIDRGDCLDKRVLLDGRSIAAVEADDEKGYTIIETFGLCGDLPPSLAEDKYRRLRFVVHGKVEFVDRNDPRGVGSVTDPDFLAFEAELLRRPDTRPTLKVSMQDIESTGRAPTFGQAWNELADFCEKFPALPRVTITEDLGGGRYVIKPA